MPRTEIKRHWLLGPRLVTIYTERDRMLQRLGKKLGLDLMKEGINVPFVIIDEKTSEITELVFIMYQDKSGFCFKLKWGYATGTLYFSRDMGTTYNELDTTRESNFNEDFILINLDVFFK